MNTIAKASDPRIALKILPALYEFAIDATVEQATEATSATNIDKIISLYRFITLLRFSRTITPQLAQPSTTIEENSEDN